MADSPTATRHLSIYDVGSSRIETVAGAAGAWGHRCARQRVGGCWVCGRYIMMLGIHQLRGATLIDLINIVATITDYG